MREAAVATEKKAVERAMRPARLPGERSPPSSPGSNASAARAAEPLASMASSRSGLLGVSKLGLSRYSRRPPRGGSAPARHTTHGQHSLTEEADPTQRARANGEPADHQHGQDVLPSPRGRRRGRREQG